MYETASPTVLRPLTSSSGILTSNFSSHATTTSTIDSESMSRSSTNDLSSCTSATGTPATSFTMSARPERISCWVAMRGDSFVRGWWSSTAECGGGARRLAGRGGAALLRGGRWSWSGQGHYLRGVREPGAVADQQRGPAVRRLAVVEQAFHRQRHRRRGGVAGVDDVPGDRHVLRQAELL